MKKLLCTGLLMLLTFGVFSMSADCQTWKPGPKPKVLTNTNWQVETSPYVAQQHWNSVLNKKEGLNIRVVPLGASLARHAAVRDGSADFALNDGSPLFYFFGLNEAADMNWGPQPLRRIITGIEEPAQCLMLTSDPKNIKTPADIRGKRVGSNEGTATYNYTTMAYLATGGVYKEDVKIVNYPSFGAMVDGFLRKEIDVMYTANPAPPSVKIEASPIGAHAIPLPSPNDKEAINKLRKHDPFGFTWISMYAKKGNGILPNGTKVGPDNPVPSISYVFPTITMYDKGDKNKAYWIIKLLSENFNEFMKDAPIQGMITCSIGLKEQFRPNVPNTLPWHEGAIEYLKEVGVWTAEMEKTNNLWLQREKIVHELWKEEVSKAKKEGVSGSAFSKRWETKIRKMINDEKWFTT